MVLEITEAEAEVKIAVKYEMGEHCCWGVISVLKNIFLPSIMDEQDTLKVNRPLAV